VKIKWKTKLGIILESSLKRKKKIFLLQISVCIHVFISLVAHPSVPFSFAHPKQPVPVLLRLLCFFNILGYKIEDAFCFSHSIPVQVLDLVS